MKNRPNRSPHWTAAILFAGVMLAGLPNLHAQDCTPSGVAQDAIICDGGLAEFIVSGLDASTQYDIDFDTDGGGPDGQATSITTNGSGEATIFVTMTAADDGATFSVTMVERTDLACSDDAPLPGGLVSTTVQVNIAPSAVSVNSTPDGTVCLNSELIHEADVTPAAPNNGAYTYSWAGCNGVAGALGCGPAGSGFTPMTGPVVTRAWTFDGQKSVEVTVSTPGCPDEVGYGSFIVDTDPAPGTMDETADGVCAGSSITLDPVIGITSGTITGYTWSTTSDSTDTQSGTGNITGTVSNASSSVVNIEYTVVPSTANCDGSAYIITVPVNPAPQLSIAIAAPTTLTTGTSPLDSYTANATAAATVCGGATITVNQSTTTATDANTNPLWIKLEVPVLPAGVSITGSLGGLPSGDNFGPITSFPTFTGDITNTSGSAQTITYIATPYFETTPGGGAMLDGSECAGSPLTMTVTVEPAPQMQFTISAPTNIVFNAGSPSLTTTICNGTIASASAATVGTITPSGSGAVWVKVDLTDANDFFGTGGTGVYHYPIGSVNFANINFTTTSTSNQTVSATLTPYIETTPGGGATLDLGECTGDPLSFNITILPESDVTVSAKTEVVCSGSIPISTFTVSPGDGAIVEGSLLSGTASGFSVQRKRSSGDAIDDATLINTSSANAVVRYIITSYNFGTNTTDDSTLVDDCVGGKDTVDVTVRPTPGYTFDIAGVTFDSGNPTANINVCDGPSNVTVTAISQDGTTIAAAKLGVRFEATGTDLFLGATALTGTPLVVEGSMTGFNATPLWANQPLALRLANSSLTMPQTATFVITPFYDENEDGMLNNNECEGSPYTATIVVNPVPEVSIQLNGNTITADNDLLTVDNVYTFDVCDTADNVVFSNKTEIIATPNTWVSFEVISSTNVNSPGDFVIPFANFPTTAQTLSLVDPTMTGQIQVRVIPFNELSGPGNYDPALDCGGEPILVTVNVNPLPAISIDVNGTTVTSDPKDGGNAVAYIFDLCKGGATNITLDNLVEINTTDSSRVKIEVLMNTNTTGSAMGTIDDQDVDDIAASLPINTNLAAVNTMMPGLYKLAITPYRESGDAAGLDALDCVGETDTVTFNVTSSPEISIIVNNTTVTADNDLGTNDNTYSFTVCDVDNNLTLSSIASVVNSPNTYLRTEIDVNDNVTGDPQGTIVSQPLAVFQGLVPTVTDLRLVNTADTGEYRMLITPFFESGDQAGLDASDCPGEVISVTITVIPAPEMSIDINSETLSTDNNGQADASESVSLTVCNGKNNVTFSNLSQDNSSPSAAVSVAYTTVTNVTVDGSAPAGITSPLSPLVTLLGTPQSIDLELVAAGTPGKLEGYFIAFTDGPNGAPNNTYDNGECKADTLFFSITVEPRPEVSMTVNGNTLSNIGTTNQALDGNEVINLSVCHRLDSIDFSTITNALGIANVGVDLYVTGTNVNIGLPLPLSIDEKLALFNAQLPAISPVGLNLIDSSLAGSLTLQLTPFNDKNDDGDFDNDECFGDIMTVNVTINPIPFLSIDVNGETVSTDNDSSTVADRRDTVIVCNGTNNLTLSPISRVNGVNLGANDWVQLRVVNTSNVNNPLGTTLITAPVDVLNGGVLNGGLTTSLQLINPAVEGYFSMELIPFNNGTGTNGSALDAGDCRGEGGILTVRVGPIPADLSQDICASNTPNCGVIQTRYCVNEGSPAPYSSFIVGPISTNPTYAAGNTIRWYSTQTGGSPIAEPTPNVSGSGGNGPYWVTQVDPVTGCESVNRIEVKTWVRPQTTISVTQPNLTYCENDALDLFAQISGSTGNAANWLSQSFNYLQGSSKSTATSIGSSPLAGPSPATSADPNDTLYWVYRLDTYTVGGSCSSDTLSLDFDVNDAPDVNATASALACKGDTIFLFENGGDAASWSWTGPPSFTSSLQNDTIASATAANEGRYYVTVTDGNLCTNIDSVDVAFQTALDISLAVSDTAYCPPLPTNAEITVSSATAGVTYIIEELPAGTPIDTILGTGTDLTFSFTMPLATTSYQIVAEAGGCRDTLTDIGSVAPVDTVKPVLTCPLDQDVIANASCVTIADYTALATVTDNCDMGLTANAQFPPSGITIQDTTTITLYASDGNGNIGECTFDVNVVDNTPPTITQCPPNQFSNVNVNCQAVIINFVPTVVVTDNCDGAPTVVQSPAPGTLAGLGTQTVNITATDFHGQSSVCSFDITVADQTPPTITCPSDTTLGLSVLCSAFIPDYRGLVVANDNCAGALVPVQSPIAVSAGASGNVTTVTMTVNDGSQSASCTFDVTAIDTFPPVVTGPVDQNIYRQAGCEAVLPDWTASGSPLGFANDFCDGFFLAQGQFPPAGLKFYRDTTFKVFLIATDAAGNVGQDSFLVTVSDTTSPMVLCPMNDTVSVDANCNYLLTSYSALGSMDNCGPVTVTQSPAAGITVNTNQTITLTASDTSNNTSSCSFEVVLEDNTPPTIICPGNQTLTANAQCNFLLPDYTTSALPSDNCGVAGVAQTPVGGSVLLLGANAVENVTLTATDNAGNSVACSFTVTLIDLSPPTITACANDTTIYADVNCESTLGDYTGLITADDNCGNATLIYDQAPMPGFPIIAGANSVTQVVLTATDAGGNQVSCTFNVAVIDTINPVIACPAKDTVATLSGSCVAQLPDYSTVLGVTDNCGSTSINQMYSFGDTAVIVTSVPDVDSIFIWDRTTLALLDSQKVTLGGFVVNGVTSLATHPLTGAIYATVNVGSPSSRLATLDPKSGVLTDIGGLGDRFSSITFDPNGRLFGVTGNGATVAETLYEINSATAAVSTLALIGSGTQGHVISFNNADGHIYYASGLTTVSFSKIDTTSFLQTPISLSGYAISGITSALTYIGGGEFLAAELGATNPGFVRISTAGVVTSTGVSHRKTIRGIGTTIFGGFMSGPITFEDSIEVKVVAVDPSGNTDTCVFFAFAADSTAPVISCMGDTTVDADANCEGIVPDFALSSVTATDNCDDDVTISQSIAAGASFSDSVDVDLVAMDDFGNTDTCTVRIYSEDNTGPDVTCPLPQQIPADALCQAVLPNYIVQGLASATDNCTPLDTIFQSPAPGNQLLGISTFTITVTARDTFGNVGMCTFNVTTIDTTAPNILCNVPTNTTLMLDGNCEALAPDYSSIVVASDNCSNTPFPVITQSPAAGATISGAGTQTVTMTATDNDGNASTCSFSITLEDNIAPTITCKADTTVPADASCQYSIIDFGFHAVVMDNCDQPTMTQATAVGAMVPLGDTTIKLYATDIAGNVDSCTFILTVADTTKPVITCPSDTFAGTDVNCDAFVGNYASAATVADNCSQNATILQLPLPGTPFGALDTVTVLLTAVDTAGNQGFCSFKVIKRDTTPPTIVCPTVGYTVTADANCNGKLADYRPIIIGSVTDNCNVLADIDITQSPDSGTFIGGIGNSQLVTMTATDTSGNSASCTLTVTVVDLTLPSFTCPSDTIVYVDQNCDVFAPDLATMVQASAVDACGSATVTQRPIAGILLNGHNTMVNVKLFVEDMGGNIDSTCIVKVTAVDSLPPTFLCPANDTVDVINNGMCDANVSDFSTISALDNCALSVTITQSPVAGALFTGLDTATVYFADGHGNVDSCSIPLVVRDTVLPTISCPNDTIVYADDFCFWESIKFDTLSTFSAADNCDTLLDVDQAPFPGVLYGKGVMPVTLVVTDDFNNSRFCVFNVTVQDTTGPVMTCPTDRVLTANGSCQAILPDYTSLVTSFDNCDGARTITQSLPSGISVTGGGGPILLTMSSSDTEGNMATCSFNVILADNQGPTITDCPNDTIVYLGNTCEYVLADFGALITAVDGCGGGVTLNQVPVIGTQYTAGTTFGLTIVASDVANNQNLCQFNVTVADSTRPAVVCSPLTVLLDQSGNYTLDADDMAAITNGTVDNCSDSANISRFVFPNNYTCADVGSPVSVIVSVSDASLNIATCTTQVTVKPTPMTGIAVIMTPDTAICEGDTIPLRATAAKNGQTGLWTLNTSGTFSQNDQDSLADLSDLGPGVHELIWTITDQCMASADTIEITVNARPELVAQEIVAISTVGGSDGEIEAVTISGNPIAWEWSNAAPSNDTAFNLNAGTYWVIGTDANGCSSDTAYETLFDPASTGVSVNVRVALEGTYNTTTEYMNDFLRQASLLPTTDPYGQGATVLASRLAAQANTDDDIVDWVLVQLYDTILTGGYGTLAGQQAGLLRRDGFIVDPVTDLPLVFSSLTDNGYHIVVKHRNHIPMGTAISISLDNNVTLIDFFNGAVVTFDAPTTSPGGKALMISGDADGDAQVSAADILFWTTRNGTFSVYDAADLDMNGQVDALDPFGQWVNNNGKFTLLP
ncbi:MAG: HYR domain-containing protein [Bacteroidia bacterium]